MYGKISILERVVDDNVFSFFFFQAEDGIRDDLVTGVQTCALPISCWSRWPRPRPILARGLGQRDQQAGADPVVHLRGDARSEERRVGKSVDLGGRRSIKTKRR